MKPLTLQDVRRVVGGKSTRALPAVGPAVSAVCTDTRAMKPTSLFVALVGENFDAHQYLATAYEGGAIAAIVSRVPENAPEGMRLIVVPDTRVALGKLAKHVRQTLRAKVVAVAGSNGKTSTKHLVHAALGAKLKGSCSPKSFNNDIGVPLSIFAADERQDYLVLEVGTNHPGEIAHLSQMSHPEIAVITNCTAEHLEFLGDVAGVRRENSAIVEGMNAKGTLIINGDDPALLEATRGFAGKRVTFGQKETNDLFATDVQVEREGTRFKMNGRVPFFVPMLGNHAAANALAAIAVGKRLKLSDEEIARGLAAAEKPEMRLELSEVGGVTVLNDAYNANPASMRSAPETLLALPVQGRRVAILGDMRELGPTSDKLHEEVGEFAAQCKVDTLICVGPHSRHIASVAKRVGMAEDRVRTFEDSEAAAREVPGILRDGDLVLLKASRGTHLEVVGKAISEAKK
jgi:UDP-N-acetylmuramoyl-tripeptide--D-alanyl-D-alanine ligase